MRGHAGQSKENKFWRGADKLCPVWRSEAKRCPAKQGKQRTGLKIVAGPGNEQRGLEQLGAAMQSKETKKIVAE
jgi:hypothetical protein